MMEIRQRLCRGEGAANGTANGAEQRTANDTANSSERRNAFHRGQSRVEGQQGRLRTAICSLA